MSEANAAFARFLTDPLIHAAILQHSEIPASAVTLHANGQFDLSLVRRWESKGPVLHLKHTGTAPRVYVTNDLGMLRWAGAVDYEVGLKDWHQVRIPGMRLPLASLCALAGQPLARVIEVPGDPGFEIKEACNEMLGEYAFLTLICLPGNG